MLAHQQIRVDQAFDCCAPATAGYRFQAAAVLAGLDQFKAQQLSMLGLLAALIALLAVTASVATRVSADQAIRLITASGGVIVVTFVAVTAALVGSPVRRV